MAQLERLWQRKIVMIRGKMFCEKRLNSCAHLNLKTVEGLKGKKREETNSTVLKYVRKSSEERKDPFAYCGEGEVGLKCSKAEIRTLQGQQRAAGPSPLSGEPSQAATLRAHAGNSTGQMCSAFLFPYGLQFSLHWYLFCPFC